MTDQKIQAHDLEARAADARARIAALEAKREQRERERAAADAVTKLEREAAEAEAVERVEAEFGALDDYTKRVDTPGGMVIVKRPAALLVRRYMDAGKANSEAWEKLVTPCVVYPDKGAFRTLCDEYPATLQRAADAVCWLAGWGREQQAGK